MDIAPIIDSLLVRGCRFVVVGSAARALGGDVVGQFGPRDLDIVVPDTDDDRARVADALASIGGRVARTDGGWRTVTEFAGSTSAVVTPYGPVDVVFRFADGSDYDRHQQAARRVETGGFSVWCHPTRHAA